MCLYQGALQSNLSFCLCVSCALRLRFIIRFRIRMATHDMLGDVLGGVQKLQCIIFVSVNSQSRQPAFAEDIEGARFYQGTPPSQTLPILP